MKRPSYATSLLCKRCEAGYSITGSRCEHLEVMGPAVSREQANRSTWGVPSNIAAFTVEHDRSRCTNGGWRGCDEPSSRHKSRSTAVAVKPDI
jgi:hypothetical protein